MDHLVESIFWGNENGKEETGPKSSEKTYYEVKQEHKRLYVLAHQKVHAPEHWRLSNGVDVVYQETIVTKPNSLRKQERKVGYFQRSYKLLEGNYYALNIISVTYMVQLYVSTLDLETDWYSGASLITAEKKALEKVASSIVWRPERN